MGEADFALRNLVFQGGCLPAAGDGMTAALAQDLQEHVSDEWRQRLPGKPDGGERSVKALAKDQIRLVRERDTLRVVRETSGAAPMLPDTGRGARDGEDR